MAAPMPSWDFYLLAGLPILLTILGLSLQLSKDRKELRRERAYKKAAKDHGLAVRCLRIIVPKLIGSCGVYEEIIRDQDFRERIRTYLGELNPGTLQFEPFQLTHDQMDNPECCRTIEEVIKAVEDYEKNSPEKAKQLNLPRR